ICRELAAVAASRRREPVLGDGQRRHGQVRVEQKREVSVEALFDEAVKEAGSIRTNPPFGARSLQWAHVKEDRGAGRISSGVFSRLGSAQSWPESTWSSHHNLAAMDPLDVVVVGGCGHVGLPLALSLAECGYRVGIDDIDEQKIQGVRSGQVPFRETGADALLTKLLPTGRLELSSDPAMLRRTRTVIHVIGTP